MQEMRRGRVVCFPHFMKTKTSTHVCTSPRLDTGVQRHLTTTRTGNGVSAKGCMTRAIHQPVVAIQTGLAVNSLSLMEVNITRVA
jgi:hypothetical protein